MKRLLLLTSDEVLHKSVQLMLSHLRTSVHCAEPAREAVELARLGKFDLLVVDIDRTSAGGRTARALMPQMRDAIRTVPFLFLDAAGVEEDKLHARCAPCQTLAKPFHRTDLLASVASLLQRRGDPVSETLDFGRLSLDLTYQQAYADGRPLPLTPKEYEILELLAFRQGTTLTKSMFLSHLYPDGNEPEMKIIDVFVCKLRKKLTAALGEAAYIHTVWGRGYVFRRPAGGDAQPAGDGLRQQAGA